MRSTIDTAGRIVIPKRMRDAVGLAPGPVEINVDGAAIRIEPVMGTGFVEKDGFLVLADTQVPMTDDDVRELRMADQR